MRLACRWASRGLAIDALMGRRPAGHAAACEHCRREWERLTALAGALSQDLSVPAMSESFDERVLTKVGEALPRQRRHGLVPVLAGAALFAAIACGIWVLTRPAPAPTVVVAPSAPVHQPQLKPGPTKKPQPQIAKVETNLAGHAVRRWHRTHHKLVAVEHVAPKKTLVATARKVDWSEVAAYYEKMGYYTNASDAYGRAYAEKRDPSLAYSAGCAAERAGDVSHALTYYIELLDKTNETDHSPG